MLRRNSQERVPGSSLTLGPKRRKKMVAVTYGVARVPDTKAAAPEQTAAPRKNFWARLMDAMIEARMQQARREIAMHVRYLPYTFDEPKDRLVKSNKETMPFGGW
jgi:hypothetical protein